MQVSCTGCSKASLQLNAEVFFCLPQKSIICSSPSHAVLRSPSHQLSLSLPFHFSPFLPLTHFTLCTFFALCLLPSSAYPRTLIIAAVFLSSSSFSSSFSFFISCFALCTIPFFLGGFCLLRLFKFSQLSFLLCCRKCTRTQKHTHRHIDTYTQ